MRIIARHTLLDFAGRHPETKPSLERWYRLVKGATYKSAQDVTASFASAKVINGERVRFEIHGGNYRLIVAFDFEKQIAFIKFVGTHAQYDAIDAARVDRF